jgi:hypothetical protein
MAQGPKLKVHRGSAIYSKSSGRSIPAMGCRRVGNTLKSDFKIRRTKKGAYVKYYPPNQIVTL